MSRRDVMPSKSFFEVLEQQIRSDLRSEIEAEVRSQYAKRVETPAGSRATAARLHTWLSTAAEHKVRTPRPSARVAYGAPKPRPQSTNEPRTEPKPDEPTVEVSSPEQIVALELLNRHSGRVLTETFTQNGLNRAWRKAAFATHPDRFTQADPIAQARAKALFCELAKSFEILEKMFA